MTGVRGSWIAALAVGVAGLLAVVGRPTAPPLPPPDATAAVLASFAPATLARVEAWVTPIRVAFVLGILLQLGVLVVLLGTRRGRRLLVRAGGRRAAGWRAAATVGLVMAVATAPLRWWIGWSHAGEFGFRTSSALRFVTEAVIDVALDVAVLATAAAVLAWLVRRRPDDWPAVATLSALVVGTVVAIAYPMVVAELRLDPGPLDDALLAEEVTEVLAASELDDVVVLVGEASVRTTRANAFVSGIGPSTEVVLYDTLLDQPADEVAAVVAHEVAHVEHRDVARGVLAGAAGVLAASSLALVVTRPLGGRWWPPGGALGGAGVAAVLVAAQLAAMPLVALESRRAEAAADHRALELTGDPAHQVAAMRRFVVEDLVDPDPPDWVVVVGRTHPTPEQRIRAAVAFAARHGLDPVP